MAEALLRTLIIYNYLTEHNITQSIYKIVFFVGAISDQMFRKHELPPEVASVPKS